MTAHPREFSAGSVAGLATLILALATRLLADPTPEHRALGDQPASGRLVRVPLTGVGLDAYFEHPVQLSEWCRQR